MSRLCLVEEPVNRQNLEDQIAQALADDDTLIFLDTSLLLWMYSLHDAARRELIDWLLNSRTAGRVRIPRRVAHEFSRHRRNPSVLAPSRGMSAVPKLLKQLQRSAHLVIDDRAAQRAGFTDRADYLKELQNANTLIDKLVAPVSLASDGKKIEADLIPAINQLAMEGDIFSGIDQLQREYEARAEVRMPPGFRDLKKKGQGVDNERGSARAEPDTNGANRFGDFAIWNEILASIGLAPPDAAPAAPAVIIITHDVKDDWSYTPLRILDLDGRAKANDEKTIIPLVTVPQPLLAHELFLRTGIDTLHIITAPQLARFMTRPGAVSPLVELARATQVEEEAQIEDAAEAAAEAAGGDIARAGRIEPAPNADNVAVDAPPPIEVAPVAPPLEGANGELPPADAIAFLEALPGDVRADRTYLGDAAGAPEMESVIRDLKSLNWYTQNPAVERGMQLLAAGPTSLRQAFIFGRNIYQAACGSANEAIGVLYNLVSELEPVQVDTANAFYAGALCEAYFDNQGQVRARPKAGRISELFSIQTEPRYAASVAWLNAALAEVADHYLALPAAAPPRYHFDIAFSAADDRQVEAIHVGNIALTEPYDLNSNGDGLPPRAQYARLSQRISKHFAIPENQFLLLPNFTDTVSFGELQLRDWGPETEVVWRE